MKLPKGKYTRCDVYLLKSGKSAGRYQARFHFKNEEKNRWDYHTQLIPKDVAKKSKKARERWAKKKLEERNERIAEALLPEPDREHDGRTVDEMVTSFLEYQLSNNLISIGAYEDQLKHYEKHIKERIGDIGFLSLTRYDIQDLLVHLNSVGLVQSTIYHYVKIVRKVYNYYCPLENIVNPFASVPLTKGDNLVRKSHLTSEQMGLLKEAAAKEFELYSPMYTGILLMFYCGLRRGEICGLRWRNIDFKTGWITIDTSIASSVGKQYPKLPKGNKTRTFPLNPVLLKYLSDMKEEKQPGTNSFVLTGTDEWYSIHVFTKHFTAFQKEYELVDFYNKPVVPHGIRHNLASVGIRAGMDMASLSDMFGHSSIAMTTDIYGDVSQAGKVVGAERLAKQFELESDKPQE